MLSLARATTTAAQLEAAGYRRLSLAWEVWGIVALATPFAALALMILKPAL